jgi:hypothetical protein
MKPTAIVIAGVAEEPASIPMLVARAPRDTSSVAKPPSASDRLAAAHCAELLAGEAVEKLAGQIVSPPADTHQFQARSAARGKGMARRAGRRARLKQAARTSGVNKLGSRVRRLGRHAGACRVVTRK